MPPRFGAESSQRRAPRGGRTGFESALRRAEQLRALRRAVRASVSLPEVTALAKAGRSPWLKTRGVVVIYYFK